MAKKKPSIKPHTGEIDEKRWYEEKRRSFSLFTAVWKVLRIVLVYLAALLLVFGLLERGLTRVHDYFLAPMVEGDTETVVFEVPSGSSLDAVSRKLEAEGLIRNSTFFKFYADFRGMGQRIQSGEYELTRSKSASQIVETLVSGAGQPKTQRITVIPGWTVPEIASYLDQQGLASEQEVLELCRDLSWVSTDYYFLGSLAGGTMLYPLEGYLSPNTYEVYTSAGAKGLLRKLLSQTEASYLTAYEERADAFHLSMHEVFTLASMIEKEAKRDDFAKVSAVFHNRLQKGMSLDSDATIKYVTGSKKMALGADDLKLDSPYNTYRKKGLPAGPICNPSMDAIIAALYPDETFLSGGYLYFCSMDPDSGMLYFSKTLSEHETAVARYRPLWEAYDRDKGWN